MDMKWTITAGELLQAISVLVAAFGLYNRLSIQIATLKADVEMIKGWWQGFILPRERGN